MPLPEDPLAQAALYHIHHGCPHWFQMSGTTDPGPEHVEPVREAAYWLQHFPVEAVREAMVYFTHPERERIYPILTYEHDYYKAFMLMKAIFAVPGYVELGHPAEDDANRHPLQGGNEFEEGLGYNLAWPLKIDGEGRIVGYDSNPSQFFFGRPIAPFHIGEAFDWAKQFGYRDLGYGPVTKPAPNAEPAPPPRVIYQDPPGRPLTAEDYGDAEESGTVINRLCQALRWSHYRTAGDRHWLYYMVGRIQRDAPLEAIRAGFVWYTHPERYRPFPHEWFSDYLHAYLVLMAVFDVPRKVPVEDARMLLPLNPGDGWRYADGSVNQAWPLELAESGRLTGIFPPHYTRFGRPEKFHIGEAFDWASQFGLRDTQVAFTNRANEKDD